MDKDNVTHGHGHVCTTFMALHCTALHCTAPLHCTALSISPDMEYVVILIQP
jgi:hypothetical protein